MQDSQIIRLIRLRDEKGLSLLYDKYADALYGVIDSILNNTGLSEEVLSQTMLKAWNKIDSFNVDKSSLFTWLMSIARHTAIDKRRLKSYENHKKTDSLSSNVYKIAANESASTMDAKIIIGLLDEKYRQVLEKIYLEGYSHSEAAEILEIPLGTIKTRLRKAILILRDELKEEKNIFFGFIFLLITIILLG